MNNTKIFLLIGLALATFVSLIVGPPKVTIVKVTGVGISLIAFFPIFFLLKRALADSNTLKVMGTFVAGFFVKLAVLLIGIWFTIARLGWEPVEIAVPTLSFTFVFQVFESLYFWEKKNENFDENDCD
ncbi:MAG: hypothetical protein H8E61_09435 [Bacteroidetes bacterium]|nr:hypothetical protein [Bacteroidota bacterium]